MPVVQTAARSLAETMTLTVWPLAVRMIGSRSVRRLGGTGGVVSYGVDLGVVLSRAERRPNVSLWPLRLRDPLPVIPVPLRAPDPDVRLDLREVLDRVYDFAGYADYIYSFTPQPPLHPEDARWAEALARQPTR